MNITKRTVYFEYGSNLWMEQMAQRCPESHYEGIAILRDWKWIINARGYANIIRSPGDMVYGLSYSLSATDESNLDCNEGVPIAYVKDMLTVDFYPDMANQTTKSAPVAQEGSGSMKQLVYVDFKRVTPDEPQTEYIYRINMGIKDALSKGVPQGYIDEYLRPYIPKQNEELLPQVASPRVAPYDKTEGNMGQISI